MATIELQIVQHNQRGFDQLLSLIERGTRIQHLEPYLEPAFAQLELDEVLSAQTTDKIVDLLLKAQEELQSGHSAEQSLAEVARLYAEATHVGMEEVWREIAESLSEDQLVTESWLDLERAVGAARAGHGDAVFRWVDEMEKLYLETWDGYEALSILEDEITSESVLGHLLLREGVDCWLEALAVLRDFCLAREPGLEEKIWKSAEEGQRLLIAVQLAEAEYRQARPTLLPNWN